MTAPDVDALEAARAAALREAIRQTIDDETLLRTGRSIGDLASGHVADEVMAGPLAPLLAAVRERDALRAGVADLRHVWETETLATFGDRLRALLAAVDGGGQ